MIIAGVDEAGRGPLAGPVVAAAVILPLNFDFKEIADSKQLKAKDRETLFEYIRCNAIKYSIIAIGHHRIDQINIREATKLAMSIAIDKVKPELALIDGNMKVPCSCNQKTIIKGDSTVPIISAASILAKVYRDKLMTKLDLKYPGYGLSKHQGYPTAIHRLAIQNIGPSKIHRKTFRGVKEFVAVSKNNIFSETEISFCESRQIF